jgi:hypothetical protein
MDNSPHIKKIKSPNETHLKNFARKLKGEGSKVEEG